VFPPLGNVVDVSEDRGCVWHKCSDGRWIRRGHNKVTRVSQSSEPPTIPAVILAGDWRLAEINALVALSLTTILLERRR